MPLKASNSPKSPRSIEEAAEVASKNGGDVLDDLVQLLARTAARDAQNTSATGDSSQVAKAAKRRRSADSRKRRSTSTSKPKGARTVSAQPDAADATLGSSDIGEATREVPPPLDQPPLSIRDIAIALGVSDDVARSLLSTNKIAGFKAGGQWRAMPQAVTDFIMKQLAKPG